LVTAEFACGASALDVDRPNIECSSLSHPGVAVVVDFIHSLEEPVYLFVPCSFVSFSVILLGQTELVAPLTWFPVDF